MATQRIPFVGNITDRDVAAILGASQLDQFMENVCFRVVKNDITRTQRVQITPSSTLNTLVSPGGSGENRAVMVWLGSSDGDNIVSARGDSNSEMFEDTTSRSSITGLARFLSETTISGVANFVVISATSGGRTWFYPAGGALTEITDTDFPPKQSSPLTITGNAVHLDGYMFVMCTNGEIWNSDLNSLANWSATSKITADRQPDGGIGIARLKDMIVAFGKSTIEFYRNTGNASGSPLSRIPDATINMGAINQYSIIQFRDSIAFIGVSKENTVGVYLLDGGKPVPISTGVVNEYIAHLSSNALGLCVWADRGGIQLGIRQTAITDNALLLYDPEVGLWTQWVGNDTINGTDVIVSPTAASGMSAVVACADGTVKRVRNLTPSSEGLGMRVVLGPIDGGTMNRKTWKKLRLIGDGLGLGSASGLVSVSCSYDSTGSFGSARSISTAAKDPAAWRLGMSRSLYLKFTTAGNFTTGTTVWLDSAELEYEVNST